MLQGVGVICFSMSYLIVFALELIRSRTHNNSFYGLTLLALLSGCVAHSAYLGNNFLFQNMRIVSGMQGWFLLLAWGLVLIYLYFLVFYSNKQFGLFLLPLIFLLIGAGIWVGDSHFSLQTTGRLIRGIHGFSLLIATFLVVIGFITGGMYFMQWNRLKRKNSTPGNSFFPNVPLPSLEWLQRMNRRSVKLSTVFLGIGVVSGYYVNFVVLDQTLGGTKAFYDAMITGTTLMFLFMLIVLLGLSWTHRLNDGRKIALLTVICFLVLLTVLLIGVFSRQTHWQKKNEARQLSAAPKFNLRDRNNYSIDVSFEFFRNAMS